MMGFVEQLMNVTTNDYDSLTELHTPLVTVTTARPKSSQSFLAVAWQRLAMVDVPLTLGSRPIPVPQLPASNSNSSLGLNGSCPLTLHWLTHWTSLSSLKYRGKDRIENTVSHFCASIVAVESCLFAKSLLSTHAVVTQQPVYISQRNNSIVWAFVFYAVRVVSKESWQSVLTRTCLHITIYLFAAVINSLDLQKIFLHSSLIRLSDAHMESHKLQPRLRDQTLWASLS
jgi:hypothetical protein